MKKILFPTDFSEVADNAFVYALKFAEQMGASISTLHAFQRPDIRGVNLPNTMREIYESIDLEEMDEYRSNIPHLDRIAEESGCTAVPRDHMMVEGDPKKVILHVAKAENVDLIIMGTTGASLLKEIFVGSTAGEIMENAHVPVLAVPRNARFDGAIDRLAITTTFEDKERIALRRVLGFAQMFGAELHCINVDLAHTEDLKQAMPRFKAEFADEEKLHFHVLEGTDLMKTIAAFLTEQQIDILAMITHKRSFFQELFSYSHAKAMSYHASTPILAFQEVNLA